MPAKRKHPQVKSQLHTRNKHKERYDFEILVESCPELKPYVRANDFGDLSIDFANPLAVKMLNTALLKHFYKVDFWDIPEEYLCPPIPGRADYLLYAADLLAEKNYGKIPKGTKIKCLDIGTGANLIYPVIGHQEYGWSFVGSEIDAKSIKSAEKIIENNPPLKGNIEVRLQKYNQNIFRGVIKKDERYDMVVCNPPFHSSAIEAQEASQRKVSNLSKGKKIEAPLNFGGQSHELWCKGGEEFFLKNMVIESRDFAQSCFWFTSLISRESRVKNAIATLKKFRPKQIKVIPMGQGNKVSRFVAWTFLTDEEQKEWAKERWK
ncbi:MULTISPECIES: 23S rRNA (adenine(1618)-N(6))-methyltransferase RlmF [unclassified Lentimicrobium]|uniref:23S rRNA (adenine(1618)-N(6))-methyltransferase RlmF n=1 Tax=unclassified Lentimicrobium TaxID=2677434 RepID=UPI0015527757|nr:MULTISPECIES: 23S rRNA (adenine(1618)-N(6))-methyltransferase RlmF [unclassified Lentimicrobium]NPD46655.1 23S rRNA (adenine(1618)-N(6))-methyltransferase RlmF [Lentimicrobium sp. S6]NPD85480.1 23S rRNA (adenine(1618)-N(6))-methyltransferase RlmF [Lentimicrobium sp. L6]